MPQWVDNIEQALRYYPLQIGTSGLIGMCLGLLGCFVVLRRMALIGDALSHAILPGVVIAFLTINLVIGHLSETAGLWGLFLGALIAGLITAVGIGWVSRHSRAKEDSAIGIVFTAMFGLGVILISQLPEGTHFDLTCFLFGEPLAIKSDDMLSIALVTPIVVSFVLIGFRALRLLSFDPQMAAAIGMKTNFWHYAFMGILAAAVVAALRTVGVIMSVAMLITPAAAAYQLTNRLGTMLLLSGLFGATSATFGFLAAFALNIPTGPAMVLFATMIFVTVLAVAPEYGLISRFRRRRAILLHILEEDILKTMLRHGRPIKQEELVAIRFSAEKPTNIVRSVRRLLRGGFLVDSSNGLKLTTEGQRRGQLLLRSHRLWERYLADEMVPDSLIHDTAERLEHAHHLAETLDQKLGSPTTDPHGEPIPEKPENASKY